MASQVDTLANVRLRVVVALVVWAGVHEPTSGQTVSNGIVRGLGMLERGKFDEAVECLEKAATQSTSSPQALRFLTKAYEGTQEWAKAVGGRGHIFDIRY